MRRNPWRANSFTDRFGLIPAMFDQQSTTRQQIARSTPDDGGQIIEPGGPAHQRTARFVMQGREMWITVCDVRWIGNDQMSTRRPD